MCSQYWTLKDVEFICPHCGSKEKDNIQTHFLGDVGSCVNYYSIDEDIDELSGWSGTIEPPLDDFIGGCSNCKETVWFGALALNGHITNIWPLKEESSGYV